MKTGAPQPRRPNRPPFDSCHSRPMGGPFEGGLPGAPLQPLWGLSGGPPALRLYARHGKF